MNSIRVECVTVENGKTVFHILVDKTRMHGILRATNEISLGVVLSNSSCRICSGWEIGCGGDWSWMPGEESEFEEMHPGLLAEIAEVVNDYVGGLSGSKVATA